MTLAPSEARRLTSALPINPDAPVTRTVRLRQNPGCIARPFFPVTFSIRKYKAIPKPSRVHFSDRPSKTRRPPFCARLSEVSHGPHPSAMPQPVGVLSSAVTSPTLREDLIFVISQPRLGSTFLQRLLAGHPEVQTSAETWLMLHPASGLSGTAFKQRIEPTGQRLVSQSSSRTTLTVGKPTTTPSGLRQGGLRNRAGHARQELLRRKDAAIDPDCSGPLPGIPASKVPPSSAQPAGRSCVGARNPYQRRLAQDCEFQSRFTGCAPSARRSP